MVFTQVRRLARQLGFDVAHYSKSDLARRARIIARHGIDLVLDVGANHGQYAKGLRSHGYRAEIISFEPVSAAYSVLAQACARDPKWSCFTYALGSEARSAQIHVALSNDSSSLLAVSDELTRIAPGTASSRTETIEVRPLDEVYGSLVGGAAHVMLKIDAQGFEREILRGAEGSLPKLELLQLEMSLAEMYRGETLLPEMLRFLDAQGFTAISLENGLVDRDTGYLKQVDGLFARL